MIAKGNLINYVHMEYASTFSSYTILVIKQGELIERNDLSWREFERHRKRRFEAYKKTAVYQTILKETLERTPNWSEKDAEEFLICLLRPISSGAIAGYRHWVERA